MMTLWTGFRKQNFASDNKIDPNEEEEVNDGRPWCNGLMVQPAELEQYVN